MFWVTPLMGWVTPLSSGPTDNLKKQRLNSYNRLQAAFFGLPIRAVSGRF
jgi:hypothetical protein